MADNDSRSGELNLPNVETLRTFLTSPRQFILGAVLTTIVEATLGLVTVFIRGLQTIFLGSNPGVFNAENEVLGIADLPVLIADEIIGVGSTVVSTVVSAIESLNQVILGFGPQTGFAAPLFATALVSVELVAAVWLTGLGIDILLDAIPGGGAIADRL